MSRHRPPSHVPARDHETGDADLGLNMALWSCIALIAAFLVLQAAQWSLA